MLFNSYLFLLLFLPIALAGHYLASAISLRLAAFWLCLTSFVFYGWWNPQFVALLALSIAFNYVVSRLILRFAGHARLQGLVTALGVGADLAALFHYKYFATLFNFLGEWGLTQGGMHELILPLGISFFTFTQIGYLLDCRSGIVKERSLLSYVLFVTFFPHLIAGPILHHKEMMPQFAQRRTFRLSASNVAIGSTIFFIGLAKKVLIADNIGAYAAPLFNEPAAPSLLLAWGGVLAYAFQLYFDFSGYSDMAIGLSRLFGVRLPLNFDSPYKARNIAQFWRRWHMTLSRFLRDYLYIPLGGNRCGPLRRHVNLMLTMVLGGLWHGAGWNFIVWGALHGAYLGIHKGWGAAARRLHLPSGTRAGKLAATLLTFTAVCVAWVFFRAPDMPVALTILKGMAGGFGLALPDALAAYLLPLQPMLAALGVVFYLGGGTAFVETWTSIALAALIAFGLPNTQQIMRRFEPALDFHGAAAAKRHGVARWLTWRATPAWAGAIALLALASLLALNRPAQFLYFQF